MPPRASSATRWYLPISGTRTESSAEVSIDAAACSTNRASDDFAHSWPVRGVQTLTDRGARASRKRGRAPPSSNQARMRSRTRLPVRLHPFSQLRAVIDVVAARGKPDEVEGQRRRVEVLGVAVGRRDLG